jgi:hypothetical protein
VILGSTKEEVDRLLGKPVMEPNILGLNHAGEKTFAHPQGPFDVLVGYFDGIARTMAVIRRRGPLTPLAPSEISAALALNAPASTWKIERVPAPPKPSASAAKKTKKTTAKSSRGGPATYFSHIERDPKIKDRVTREMFGFMPGGAPWAFFYLPVVDGGMPLIPGEWAVAQKLG